MGGQELGSSWARQDWVSWPTAESWATEGVWAVQTVSGDQRVPLQAAMVF